MGVSNTGEDIKDSGCFLSGARGFYFGDCFENFIRYIRSDIVIF